MQLFTVATKKLGWSYTFHAANAKDAVNKFLDTVGVGVPFSLKEGRPGIRPMMKAAGQWDDPAPLSSKILRR